MTRGYVLRDLVQRPGLRDCESWKGKSRLHRAGDPEGQLGLSYVS